MHTITYRAEGVLTSSIAEENLSAAQEYLQSDNMTQYLDEDLAPVIAFIQWRLHADGHAWSVDAHAIRELTDVELKSLADWVSGQNSDGLGEGFEQQEFAELREDCGDCWNCENGYSCEDESGYGMISFDWKTNPCTFAQV